MYNICTLFILCCYLLPDLPSQLEAAWSRGEACGNVEVMEQFAVTLRTAQRLGLPLSPHLSWRLRQKGVLVEDIATLGAAENQHWSLQPPSSQTDSATPWNVNVSSLPKGIERNNRNRGTFRGFSKNAFKQGNWRSQNIFRGK